MMQAKILYYLILLVYSLLWFLQMVTCHLTHSLIVSTDSYINLYKILEISLGILHLQLQHEARDCKKARHGRLVTIYSKFFNRTCTYQYKRLPVLGSFVNSLFLAALLMSAAIEGIQTCFHASHSTGEVQSILLQNQITYPAVLVGFALVGLLLQWCSDKVHKMRDDELASESVLNLAEGSKPLELDPCTLLKKTDGCQPTEDQTCKDQEDTFESIPLDVNDNDSAQPKVEYLKLEPTSTSTTPPISSNSRDIEGNHRRASTEDSFDFYLLVRYCISPACLVVCALITYFIHDELITEVADALLSVVVVILLFSLSYPPMKKASKILLQSAPVGVSPDELKARIKSASGAIVEVRNLHVWSLSAKNNPVASCEIVLRKEEFENGEAALTALLRAVRFKLLEASIECCTVQPVLVADEAAPIKAK